MWHECRKFDDTLRVAKSSIVNTNGTASPGRVPPRRVDPCTGADAVSADGGAVFDAVSAGGGTVFDAVSAGGGTVSDAVSADAQRQKTAATKTTRRRQRGEATKKAPKKAPKKARKKTLKNSRTKTTPTKTPTATTLTTTTPTTTPTATTPTTTPTAKAPTDDGVAANDVHSSEKTRGAWGSPSSACGAQEFGQMCEGSEAPGGLYFAYRSKNGVCYEQPKPWTECRRIGQGPYHLYSMKAELALGHAEPALGHAHGREISMRYVASRSERVLWLSSPCAFTRRSKRWTNIEESRTLDPRNKRSYGAVV